MEHAWNEGAAYFTYCVTLASRRTVLVSKGNAIPYVKASPKQVRDTSKTDHRGNGMEWND